MNRIRAAFFDIDGTIVGFKKKVISDNTIRALKELKNNGVLVFIASGRSKPLIKNVKDFDFDGYVTMNGAYVTYRDEVIVDCPIPKEDAIHIAKISDQHKFACEAFLSDSLAINLENDRTEAIKKFLNIDRSPVVNMPEMASDGSIYQYTVYVTEDEEAQYFSDTHKKVTWHRWHPEMADVIPFGVSKGGAIAKVLEYLGINKEETISFGDGGNDLDMLQATGIGVAMDNAQEEVKAVADYITSNADEDGVVKALEYFGLIHEQI